MSNWISYPGYFSVLLSCIQMFLITISDISNIVLFILTNRNYNELFDWRSVVDVGVRVLGLLLNITEFTPSI